MDIYPITSETNNIVPKNNRSNQVRNGNSVDFLNHVNNKDGSPGSLEGVFRRYGSFPEFSVILGQCDDGLPFLLDLAKPKPGAILIYRNTDRTTVDIINTVCISGAKINSPENLAICMIANDPDDYLGVIGYPHCQAMFAPFERSAGNMIYELSAIAEQRRYGRERGAAILLIIDDLFSFLSHNTDYGVFVNFKWLVNFGPQSMVWPIVTVRNSTLSQFNNALITLFPFTLTSHNKNILPMQNNQFYDDQQTFMPVSLQARFGSNNISFHPYST